MKKYCGFGKLFPLLIKLKGGNFYNIAQDHPELLLKAFGNLTFYF